MTLEVCRVNSFQKCGKIPRFILQTIRSCYNRNLRSQPAEKYHSISFVGGILPSLLGPQMVTDPFKQPLVSKDCVAYQIHLYLLIYFVLSVALFIIFWCHFPDNYDIVELPANMNNSLKSDCLQVLS